MILQRSFAFLLLFSFFVFVCSPQLSSAMDPRFELDPAQVQKKTVRSPHQVKSSRGRSAHRTGRTHKKLIALQKNSHEQPVSAFQVSAGDASNSAIPDIQKARSFWDTLIPPGDSQLQP
ncbi:MAG: hypothetical protein OEL57_13000, partial [Trichlorobacter sp.]|uniref:hypothetical protein n=1 Tax=Trichlorobacter sp. TaxID=2911007 RepID=UPI00256D8F19